MICLATRAVLGLAALSLTVSAAAQEPPVCAGNSLMDQLKERDAAAYERVVAAGKAVANGGALLWKVEKPGVAPSHLFGTIHITDPAVRELPVTTRKLIEGASTVVLEVIDLTDAAAGEAMMEDPTLAFITAAGTPIDKLLTASEMDRLVEFAGGMGLPRAALVNFRPWLLSTMLAIPLCETTRQTVGVETLDSSIEKIAKSGNIKRVGLETIGEQFRSMAAISDEAQLANLKLSIGFVDQLEDSLATLIGLYKARQVPAIMPLMAEMAAGPQAEIAKLAIAEFQQKLIDDRNFRMRDRALPVLEQGNAFIAVGALHLPGDKGLVNLLRDAGYTVTAAE